MITPLWQPDLFSHRPLICDFIDLVNQTYSASISNLDYYALHAWSVTHKKEFWSLLWDFSNIAGDQGHIVIDPIDTPPFARFFPNGSLNYAENMLQHWINHPDQDAIIYRHQDQPSRIISGQDLCHRVSIWEQALRRAGIGKNDVVGVYLPNVPEVEIILIAAANIGAILCTAGMEMGTDDLIGRFSAAQPKILISAPSYEYGNKTIDRSDTLTAAQDKISSLEKIVLLDVPSGHDRDGFLDGLSPKPLVFDRHDFNHPLYILFSSGSTGVPKCFVHSAGGVLLKHVCEYKLQSDIQIDDRAFYHATPSWMMWNWAASCLAVGATQLLYSGNPFYPDAGAQLRFTADHKCTHHGTAAPVIMGWRDQNLTVKDDLDLSDLRSILYTGAVLPEQGFTYLHDSIKDGVHISGISGGTDIVGCFITGNPITPVYAGQMAGPCLGVDLEIWSDDGHALDGDTTGELVITSQFPSMPLHFLNDDDGTRYRDAYYDFFAGQGHTVWRHGDTIQRTSENQIIIVGRSDGTLNQNGVRIGSITLYNQLDAFSDDIQASTAVDFIRPDTKQSITILFLVSRDGGSAISDDVITAVKRAIKNNVGPYSVPTEIICAPDVLRTKNGKLAEVVTKKILAGQDIPNAELYGHDLVTFYQDVASTLHKKYS